MKEKFASRKLWAMIASLIGSILILFNVDEATTTQIVAIIGGFGAIISYILAEGYVDAKRIEFEKDQE